jgi:glucan phosphoethanolaminetransferase (alkaline phosphatase superfamily)
VLVVLLGLTLFYRFGSEHVMNALQSAPFAVRVATTVAMLAPLGLCLGVFMPFGLRAISGLTATTEAATQYVAWAWAVNGFFSVIGSVLTTILSMSYGFSTVQALAFVVYALAVVVLRRLVTREVSVPAPVVLEPVA